MKTQVAVRSIPYEIGDKVLIKTYSNEFIIKDIKMTQYVKDNIVEFHVLLFNNLTEELSWYDATLIEKRVK